MAYSIALKGVDVDDQYTVTYGSLITKTEPKKHILYAGILVLPIRK